MSDNEVVNEFNNGKIVDNDASDDDSSISDAKMKVVDKTSKIVKNGDDSDSDVENDHSSSTNNGFGVDGEPDYKPRKDSTSSSESDADDDLDEVSASSESKSKSVDAGAAKAASPPQPKSRSSSINQSVEEKKSSSSDTEDEEELPQDGAGAPAPVPVARKVSLPQHDEDDEIEKRASPVKKVDSEDDGAELTRDEWELSKRETVHLEEDLVASKASHSEVVEDEISEADEDERRKSDSSDDEEEEKKDEEKEVDEKEEDEPVRTNGGSQHKEDSSSSSSDEEEVVQEMPASPKRSLTIQSPPSREENPHEGERTPSPNVPKPNPDGSVTKAYIAALNNNNNNSPAEHDPVSKSERPTKAVKDITQMYVAKTNQTPPASPKPIARTKPAKDITQLYTGKFEQGNNATPGSGDKLSPKKHNMSTAIDKNEIRKAYDDVRSDTSTTEWAVFKFDGNSLGVTATGNDFSEFKSLFGNEDRGFGYIRIKTGDEMSKRCKFVFVTWVGPSVSVMKKAKMSTDKALMKDIIQNLSVELQLENHAEFSHDYFKMQVDKAAGARYGTGVRDL